jgi:hypothetical protein
MHSRWVRRFLATSALVVTGLLVAAPGIALAGGGASGSVEPKTVGRGDDVSFFITCATSSSDASVTGTPLGLPSDIAMVKLSAREFDLDLTVPSDAPRGTHHISMQCSDGSFATVTLVVSPHGGADTGDGAMSGGASTVALTIGGLLVFGAAAGGVLLVRRRRAQLVR